MNAPFTVLIPARLASTRLPNKPLADIAGLPMIVRVAQAAARSQAQRVLVAADDARIAQACASHGIECVLTDVHHASGSDRLAQACGLLNLQDQDLVVNVQGDEPLIDPALIDACAQELECAPDCAASTLAHPIHSLEEFHNPNVVKLVLDAQRRALYFSRAPIPCWRDAPRSGASATGTSSMGTTGMAQPAPLRHVGIYAYRVQFLRRFPSLPSCYLEQLESLEQLRILWHGEKIAVHCCAQAPAAGVDTPQDLDRVRAIFAAQ